jgi:hypothetical protein
MFTLKGDSKIGFAAVDIPLQQVLPGALDTPLFFNKPGQVRHLTVNNIRTITSQPQKRFFCFLNLTSG